LISAYALAVAEENATSNCNIVTAPTCGAAGIMPAVLYFYFKKLWPGRQYDDPEVVAEMVTALAIAGVVGLLCKANASISGAEAGC